MYKKSKYNYIVEDEKLNNVYIYNLLTRSFLCIEKSLWIDINNNNYEKIDFDSIQTMLEEGIILYNNVNEQYVLKDKIESRMVTNENAAMFLSMTSGCNFKCPYCYQDYRTNINDNLFITEEKIDIIYSYIRELRLSNLAIAYFGGEPTLNMDVLMYALNKFRNLESNMNVSHTIITNGYMLTDEILCLYKKIENLIIQFTIDGNENSHNKTRIHKEFGNTFDKIYLNLCKLAHEIPNHVAVRINVANTDFVEYYQLIDRMKKDGLAGKISVAFELVFDGQISKHTSCSDKSSILQLYEYATTQGFASNLSVEYGPCLAHAKYGFAIDEELNLYNCPGEIYGKKVGFISDAGILNIIDNEWYESRYVRKKCMKDCFYAPICFGGCKMNKKCRKETFITLLPKMVQKMIKEYEGGFK